MSKTVHYYGSLTVFGGAFGTIGLASVLSGNVNVASTLMTVGGIGIVLSVGYELAFSDDPSRHVPSDRVVWIMVASAVLAVVSGLFSIVGL